MTIEKMINILEEVIEFDDFFQYNLKYLEDFNIMIETLKQLSCEDTISKQAVLDAMSELNAISFYEAQEDSKECYYEIQEMIKNMPSVTPQQKKGQWIKYGIPRCGEQHYKCTSCGYYINFGQWGELYTKEFKYCPNCGAKM